MDSVQLVINTLGGLRVLFNGQEVTFEGRKDEALFVYLVATGRPHPRETLAEMFWEGYTQADAQRNFRRMLSNLRRMFGDFIMAPRGDFVTFEWNEAVQVDFAELESHLVSGTELLDDERAIQLEGILRRYQGHFLEGFYVDSSDFERWVTGERERLLRRVLNGLRLLVNYYLDQGRYERGIDIVSRLLKLDELDEEAHRLCMLMLALSGQRAAALRQYQTCCQLLQAAFGIEPDQATISLQERIRAGDPLAEYAPQPSSSSTTSISSLIRTIPNNLPSHLTPFVGRGTERVELRQLLEQADARLISITGLGGIGKSRLALKVAEEVMALFPDGVYFIRLADLTSVEQITPSIATALGLESYADDLVAVSLMDYVADQRMLWILDNFEHLLEGAELVTEWLADLPHLHLIVTSREMLYLRGETLFPLDGLSFDAPDNSLSSDAAQLFVQSARRTDPTFRVATGEAVAINDICRLVRGMPLALDLAASWVTVLTPTEIRDEIQQNIDFLGSQHLNVPARHRSIRAVFDSTWTRLNEVEQEGLLQLVVFRGGFTRSAAQQVAGVSLRMLNILLSKSLVYRTNQMHYAIHELFQQYLNEKLGTRPEYKHSLEVAHCHYFAAFLMEHESEIVGGMPESALQEFENIQQAWQVALANRDYGALNRLREGLWALLDARSWLQEGVHTFRSAVQVLEGQTEGEAGINYGRCLALYGYFLGRTGQVDVGYKMARQGVLLLQTLNAREAYILSAGLLAELASTESQRIEACQLIEADTPLLDEGSISRIGSVIWRYANLLDVLGHPTDAEDVLKKLPEHDQGGNRPRGQANIDWQRGQAHQRRGQHAQAHEHLLKSLKEYRALNYEQGIAWALASLGYNALQMGLVNEATQYFWDGLDIAEKANLPVITFDTLVGLVEILGQSDHPREAILTLGFVLYQRTLAPDTRNKAQTLLDTYKVQFETDEFEAMRTRGQGRALTEILALVRGILRP